MLNQSFENSQHQELPEAMEAGDFIEPDQPSQTGGIKRQASKNQVSAQAPSEKDSATKRNRNANK